MDITASPWLHVGMDPLYEEPRERAGIGQRFGWLLLGMLALLVLMVVFSDASEALLAGFSDWASRTSDCLEASEDSWTRCFR